MDADRLLDTHDTTSWAFALQPSETRDGGESGRVFFVSFFVASPWWLLGVFALQSSGALSICLIFPTTLSWCDRLSSPPRLAVRADRSPLMILPEKNKKQRTTTRKEKQQHCLQECSSNLAIWNSVFG